jgi:zinc transport system substrate-binding protein
MAGLGEYDGIMYQFKGRAKRASGAEGCGKPARTASNGDEMKQHIKKSVASPWRQGLGVLLAVMAPLLPLALAAADPAERPLVVTSIRPLTLIARELAGGDAEVRELLTAGEDPHHVALSPSRRRLLARADLVVWVGPGLEAFLAKPLAGLDAERVLTWLPGGADHGGDHGHLQGTAGDPHVWLDPAATARFARALAGRLARLEPSGAAGFRSRLADFEARLDAVDGGIAGRLAPLGDRVFVAEHAAYGPFLAHYGLQLAGSLSDPSGVALGARNLWGLKGRDDVACVAVERAPGSRLARQLAAQLGVPVVVIDPLGLDVPLARGYAGLLGGMAAGFEECLDSGQ